MLRKAFLEEEEAFETAWKEGVVLGQGQYWREMMLWRDRIRVLVTRAAQESTTNQVA